MHNPFDPGYYGSDELRGFGFAAVGDNVQIAKNCVIIGPENITIGDNVRVDAYTAMIAASGSIRLGSYIHIGGFCHITARGGFQMDDYSGLSQRVSVYTVSDDYSGRHMTNPMIPAEHTGCRISPVHVGRHAIVGSGSVLLPGSHMGEGAALGALSLACRPIPSWEVHAGSPAVKRSDRLRELLAAEALMNAA